MASTSLIWYAGLCSIAWLATKFLIFVYYTIKTSPESLLKYRHGADSWALVTGANDGIGFGFCQELVSRGFNVILLGRNRERLEGAQTKLNAENPEAKTRLLVIDATYDSFDTLSKAIDSIKSLKITILINNIGGVPLTEPPWYRTLANYSASDIDNHVNMNSRFLAYVTSLTLPILSRNNPNRSLIINISSGSQFGIPWLVMYSAVKGFMNSFSLALDREFRVEKIPIDVLCIPVGNVQTKSNTGATDWSKPIPRVFAKANLDKAGLWTGTGEVTVSLYWGHAVGLAILGLMPNWLLGRVLTGEVGKMKARTEKDNKHSFILADDPKKNP